MLPIWSDTQKLRLKAQKHLEEMPIPLPQNIRSLILPIDKETLDKLIVIQPRIGTIYGNSPKYVTEMWAFFTIKLGEPPAQIAKRIIDNYDNVPSLRTKLLFYIANPPRTAVLKSKEVRKTSF